MINCVSTQIISISNLTSYAIIAGTTVTATGNTSIVGDVIIYPGNTHPGLTQGTNVNGIIHSANTIASAAKNDLSNAYNQIANRIANQTLPIVDLGNQILVPGIYSFFSDLINLNGNLTLNGAGVYLFKITTALITSNNCNIILINGASASTIYFHVGSSVTIGTGCTVNGFVLARTSITVNGASINGGLFALNGAVTITQSSRITALTPHIYTDVTTTSSGIIYSSLPPRSSTTTVSKHPYMIIAILLCSLAIPC
ncbi:unnamed protein product [Didymodactylos carnosus]|uniref:Antifreeze protein n=1 Tax=Didymodactylos carnosus TaxID=1234261 RepID=A0A815C970_9BILA|nr:unnamed protein product [Didymodactylos carnosus]CAF1307938.1 unnamed protein product [Didymodactylos carnosus]CAF4075308.1 unnamed protein product [Didymodactylos carnosus]CAF4115244.1 unnamed protein product [Didymodactylos carnosus]